MIITLCTNCPCLYSNSLCSLNYTVDINDKSLPESKDCGLSFVSYIKDNKPNIFTPKRINNG
jgi:hypothetical protein